MLPPVSAEPEGKQYSVSTSDFKLIHDYSGLNFAEIWQLRLFTYCLLLRDAFISVLSQTEEGTAMLAKAWTLEQTEPVLTDLKSEEITIYEQ